MIKPHDVRLTSLGGHHLVPLWASRSTNKVTIDGIETIAIMSVKASRVVSCRSGEYSMRSRNWEGEDINDMAAVRSVYDSLQIVSRYEGRLLLLSIKDAERLIMSLGREWVKRAHYRISMGSTGSAVVRVCNHEWARKIKGPSSIARIIIREELVVADSAYAEKIVSNGYGLM